MRTNATASPRLDVSGPRPRIAQLARFRHDSADARVSTPFVFTSRPFARWSRRFAPTPGNSWTSSTPTVFERCAWADPGQLEEVRRADRPGADDYLVARCLLFGALLATKAVADTHGPTVLDHDTRDERLGHDGQVRSSSCVGQVAVEDAETTSSPLGDGDEPDARVVLRVQVRRERDAYCLGGVYESFGEHMPVGELRKREASSCTSGEHRLDIGPRPAGTAGCRPGVVVRPMSPKHHHRVHRSRASQHAPAWEHDLAPSELGLRSGRIPPVDVCPVELRERSRNLDLQLSRA